MWMMPFSGPAMLWAALQVSWEGTQASEHTSDSELWDKTLLPGLCTKPCWPLYYSLFHLHLAVLWLIRTCQIQDLFSMDLENSDILWISFGNYLISPRLQCRHCRIYRPLQKKDSWGNCHWWKWTSERLQDHSQSSTIFYRTLFGLLGNLQIQWAEWYGVLQTLYQ